MSKRPKDDRPDLQPGFWPNYREPTPLARAIQYPLNDPNWQARVLNGKPFVYSEWGGRRFQGGHEDLRDLARALLAASKARGTTEVEVKELEWKVLTRVISDKSTWRADSIVGRYTVIDGLAWGPEPTNEVWNCIDDDAGKARCQLDYATRIRSALVGGE